MCALKRATPPSTIEEDNEDWQGIFSQTDIQKHIETYKHTLTQR